MGQGWTPGAPPDDDPFGLPLPAGGEVPRRRRRPALRRVIVLFALLAVAAFVLPGLVAGPRGDPAPVLSPSPTARPTAGPSTTPTARPTGSTPAPTAAGSAGRALTQLAGLRVRGRAPLTGYDRDEFGDAWKDVDRNGCDTRNDILRRDLEGVVVKPGTHGCLVLSGVLVDPYSGRTLDFQRGTDTSGLVQIDHVVALADAWQSGAWQWDEERRTVFANDPVNLLAVEGALNQQKGASNAASWLPPDRRAWCAFASQQITVKSRYDLSVTATEREALERAAGRCTEDELLAEPGPVPLGAG